ncbi:MAG: hypothetical protein AAF465_05770 [Pseudomonadota bacterium]
MKARARKNTEMTFISPGKEYEVIGIEADDFRIINNMNEPCLYDPALFELIDEAEPNFWVSEIGEDGERYAYPTSWIQPGFFEDFHDGDEKVINRFWKECRTFYEI